jgi:hypothetical protein
MISASSVRAFHFLYKVRFRAYLPQRGLISTPPHRQRDAKGRTDLKNRHLQHSKLQATEAETLRAHQHTRLG